MKSYVGVSRDHSASMTGLAFAAMQDYNDTIEGIKQSSEGVDTIVSTVMCAGNRAAHVIRDVVNSSVGALKPLKNYPTPGYSTPLFDSVGELIEILESAPDAKDPDVTFLVTVITDGCENSSTRWNAQRLSKKIKDLQETDRWTFIFRVPRGYKDQLVRMLGLYSGNVVEWDQSDEGFREVTQATTKGMSKYYADVRSGKATSSKRFFTDVSRVNDKTLGKLEDLSKEFVLWRVNTIAEGETIRGFCNMRLKGQSYVTGAAHYELVKPELIQESKKILIRDNDTGAVYGGAQARALVGIPAGRYRVSPSQSDKYTIFVQSTSVNRKLPRRTRVLYYKGNK